MVADGDARSALDAARYDDVLIMVERDFGAPSLLLRATATLRKGDYEEAARSGIIAYATATSDEDRICAANLNALALSRSGNLPEAKTWIVTAFEIASPSDRLSAERCYCAAFVAWTEGDLHAAEHHLARALLCDEPNIRARSLIMAAYLASARGDRARHASLAAESLAVPGQTDVYVRANVIAQLAILARETVGLVDMPTLESAYRDLLWTPYVLESRFFSVLSLAWYHAMNGSLKTAYRYARASIDHAPSKAWLVTSHIDHAQFALAANDTVLASNEAEDALKLVDAIDWASLKGEERFALLDVAVVLLNFNRRDAKRVLALYDNLPAPALYLAVNHDERVEAASDFAHGSMQIGEPANLKRIERAHATFERIGYLWRAAECAVALSRATGSAVWTEIAEAAVKPYPKSWLAKELRGHADAIRARYPSLTNMQYRVLDLLAIGLSDKEIAARLNITHGTARNHVSDILERTGAHSRKDFYRQPAS